MLDGTLKTLLVDDSQPVANLMVVICTKIGGYVFVVISKPLLNKHVERYSLQHSILL
jgi:hypothetical protein